MSDIADVPLPSDTLRTLLIDQLAALVERDPHGDVAPGRASRPRTATEARRTAHWLVDGRPDVPNAATIDKETETRRALAARNFQHVLPGFDRMPDDEVVGWLARLARPEVERRMRGSVDAIAVFINGDKDSQGRQKLDDSDEGKLAALLRRARLHRM